MSETEVTCPYCEDDFDVSTDDGRHYQDGERQDEECPNCGKTMLIYSSCSWHREAERADCLNGSEHPWKHWYTYWVGEDGENIGKFYEVRNCDTCDAEQKEWHDKRLDTRPNKRFDEEPIGEYK